MNTQNKTKKVITWNFKLYTELVACKGFSFKVWNLDIIANNSCLKSLRGRNRESVVANGVKVLKLLNR